MPEVRAMINGGLIGGRSPEHKRLDVCLPSTGERFRIDEFRVILPEQLDCHGLALRQLQYFSNASTSAEATEINVPNLSGKCSRQVLPPFRCSYER